MENKYDGDDEACAKCSHTFEDHNVKLSEVTGEPISENFSCDVCECSQFSSSGVSAAMQTLFANYKRARYDGKFFPYPARTALYLATLHNRACAYPFKEDRRGNQFATLDMPGGFVARIEISRDDYFQMGTLTDRVEDLPANVPPKTYEVCDRNGKYLMPGEDLGDGWEFEEVFGGYRRQGMPKDAARLAALSEIRQTVRDIMRESLTAWNVRVTVSKHGVELGEDSLGGITANERYGESLDEIVSVMEEHGMLENAMQEARAKLEELTAG